MARINFDATPYRDVEHWLSKVRKDARIVDELLTAFYGYASGLQEETSGPNPVSAE